ncbi:UvrB/UvrC motif-containing protein [Clostridium paraputrificum]|uniref:UvrB/UvrC motif-containing protein n=1 Tax=Clostridium TaxID=1485 RepID=UPI003D3376E4
MLCEKCNKKVATIHIIKFINSEKSKLWLCDDCAKEISDVPLLSSLGKSENLSLQNILGGLFESLEKSGNKSSKIEVVCKKCGLTYSQYKKSGQLGCSECYDSFSDSLKPVIKRLQGDLEHIGKIPRKTGNKFIEKKRINKLRQDLQKAIITEEYEKAAIIRDEIKLLEGAKEEVNRNEKLD